MAAFCAVLGTSETMKYDPERNWWLWWFITPTLHSDLGDNTSRQALSWLQLILHCRNTPLMLTKKSNSNACLRLFAWPVLDYVLSQVQFKFFTQCCYLSGLMYTVNVSHQHALCNPADQMWFLSYILKPAWFTSMFTYWVAFYLFPAFNWCHVTFLGTSPPPTCQSMK